MALGGLLNAHGSYFLPLAVFHRATFVDDEHHFLLIVHRGNLNDHRAVAGHGIGQRGRAAAAAAPSAAATTATIVILGLVYGNLAAGHAYLNRVSVHVPRHNTGKGERRCPARTGGQRDDGEIPGGRYRLPRRRDNAGDAADRTGGIIYRAGTEIGRCSALRE